jgi:hypothetical protein
MSSIPSFREEIIDSRTGLLSMSWYRYFQSLDANGASEENTLSSMVVSDAGSLEQNKEINAAMALAALSSPQQKAEMFHVEQLAQIANSGPPLGIINERTSSYSATATIEPYENIVFLDASGGAFTVTMPPASVCMNRVFRLKRTEAGANDITIQGQGGDNIDGAATVVLSSGALNSTTLASDGSNWWIMA